MAPSVPDSFEKLTMSSGATERWESAAWNLVELHFPRVGRNDSIPDGAMLLLHQRKRLAYKETVGETVFTSVAREASAQAKSGGPACLVLDKESWREADQYVLDLSAAAALVKALVDDAVLKTLPTAIYTPYAVVEAVKLLFADASLGAAIPAFTTLIRRMSDDDSLADFLATFRKARSDLEGVGCVLSDQQATLALVYAVGGVVRYAEPVRDARKLPYADQSFEPFVTTLSTVDRQEDAEAKVAASASAATATKSTKGAKPRPPSTCDHPNHPGAAHPKSKCFAYARDKEREKKAKESASASSAAHKSTCTCNGDLSDSYLRDASPGDAMPESAVATLSTSHPRPPSDSAILDSGATIHIFAEREAFVSITSFNPPRQIVVGDNRSVPALGHGTVQLRTGPRSVFSLHKAWFAPKFGVNLVSTRQLKRIGLTSTFPPGGECAVTDASGKTVLTGREGPSGDILDAKVIRHAETAFAAATMETWHARTHLPYRKLVDMSKNSLVTGFDVKGAIAVPSDTHCNPCSVIKIPRLPFPLGRTRATETRALVHFDLAGPITPIGRNGERYWLGITDDYSGRRKVVPMKLKSETEKHVIAYIGRYERVTGRQPAKIVLTIRSDLGGENVTTGLRRFCESKFIEHEFATVRTPQQNGVAERGMRTDSEAAATFLAGPSLAELQLPASFWPYALKAAVHVNNRVPRTSANGRTPHELFHGNKPDISHLRTFGCEATYRVGGHKFDRRGQPGRFVGYAHEDGTKAWLVWDPKINKVITSRDVSFREGPLVLSMQSSVFDKPTETPSSSPPSPARQQPPPVALRNPFAALPVEQAGPNDADDDDDADDRPVPPGDTDSPPPPPRNAAGTPPTPRDSVSPPPTPPSPDPPPPASPPRTVTPDSPGDNLLAESPPFDANVPLNDVGSPAPRAPPPRPPTPAPAVQPPRPPRLPPLYQPRQRPSPFAGHTPISRLPNPRWANSATSTSSGGVDVKSSPDGTSSAAARLPDTADATAHTSRSASAASDSTSPDRPRREDETSRDRNTIVAAPSADPRDEARSIGNIPVQASGRNAPSLPTVSRSSCSTGPTTASDGTRESSDAGAAALGALGEQSSPPDVPQRPSVVPAPRHDGGPAPSASPRRPFVEILDDDDDAAAGNAAASSPPTASSKPSSSPTAPTPKPSGKSPPPPRTTKPSNKPSTKPPPPKKTSIPHDLESFDIIEAFDVAHGYYTVVSPSGSGDIMTGKEAMESVHREGFLEAERKEMASHHKHGTWRALKSGEKSKAYRTAVGSRMLYKLKRSADGSVVGYKCRLVAQGFTQVHGYDFTDTDAPTARWTSIRITLADAAVDDLELHHCDVDTAYLLAPLAEEVFMRLPDGSVVRLLKAIYGLKQSARAWYTELTRLLGTIGLKPSYADPSVFVGTRNGVAVRVVVYVDDLLIAARRGFGMDSFKAELKSLFSLKDMGEAREFLGLQIVRDRAHRRLFVHQAGYVARTLARFGHDTVARKPMLTPMDDRKHLLPSPEAEREYYADLEVKSGRSYAALVGSLQFLALCTRPDIAQATSTLGRFAHAPTPEHRVAAKRVLRYLAGSATLGLEYGAEIDLALGRLVGWTDADWGGDPSTRRSRTGFAFKLAGAAVSWQSKLQPTVATSTVHAETQGAATATREGVWLRRALEDFSTPTVGPVRIYADNQGQIAQSKSLSLPDRAKHYDIQLHFVRERVGSGELDFVYTPTAEQTADVFTKPLPRSPFQRCRDSLGLRLLGSSVARAIPAKAGGV